MKRWLHEPLLHFILLGGLLFAAWAWLNRDATGDDVIQVTAAEMTWLKESYARQWNRPPSDEELQGLVLDYVKEALLAREARALKLDEDDTVIRRRLAQKLRFVVEDTAGLAEPPEQVLREIYVRDAAQYLDAGRVTFVQHLFRDEQDARTALARLAKQPDADVGEQTLLEPRHVDLDPAALSSIFGPAFAAQVFALPVGSWQGPVPSGYGVHLVRVESRQAPEQLPFEAVRPRLREAWQRAEQARAYDLYIAELLGKYELVADDNIRPLLAPLYGARQP